MANTRITCLKAQIEKTKALNKKTVKPVEVIEEKVEETKEPEKIEE